MSGRLLSFSQYVGGADNVKVIEMFPAEQRSFEYDFDQDISNFTFKLDQQTLVVDTVTYDRNTGDPNFADSSVLGYFANVADVTANNVNTISSVDGTTKITIPSNRYTGQMTPDARTNVAITVFSVEWTNTGATPNDVSLHRWAIIERWEPGVTIGDPTAESSANGGFVSL